MEGWVKIYRQISDNPLWTCEKFTRGQAWIDLILLANHTESYFYKRGVKINIKRGQIGWSSVALSDRWKWSRSKVNKFLNDLEKEQQIKQQKTNVTQIITLLNYDKFQQKEQQTEQQKSSKRAAKEQQKDTYKNVNKEKNDNNVNKELFTEFWNKYHKITEKPKTDKEATLKYWKKLNPDEKQKAIDKIEFYFNSVSEKKYLKKARTYLSDKNFNDEFITPLKQSHTFELLQYEIKAGIKLNGKYYILPSGEKIRLENINKQPINGKRYETNGKEIII